VKFHTALFTVTTAQDESNYFTGSNFTAPAPFVGKYAELKSGTYRVVDGELLPILSGLPLDEVRKQLETKK
jgi:hypothetical protein